MPLGLSSFAVAWAVGMPGHVPDRPLTALGFLDLAAGLGLRRVQCCENLPLHRLDAGGLDAFAERAGQHGIQVELGTRGLDPDTLRCYLDLALRFASPIVRLVVDVPGDEPPPRQAVARLRPTVARFRDAGVRLALENHGRFKSVTLAQIVEELGPDAVGICLDTVNSFAALEGPEVVVEVLGPHALSVHVKDFVVRRAEHQMGLVIEGRPAGQGQLNIPWLLAALRVEERRLHPMLESWLPPGPTWAETVARERRWLEESVAYLRPLVPG
jgi:sugar phosphate isomerase/epimerase